MASDNEASCENDPNFAVICAFLEKFGVQCDIPNVDFLELQGALENTEEVPPYLIQIFLKLLKRVKRSVKNDKWEKTLVNVCHNFSSQDAWEVERFGFKKAKLSSKVRVLKELLEMQFDHHIKFKNEVNKFTAEELRSRPLGRDKSGHAYWFQSDDNYQIRVYKEDLDEETWTLIAKDRESLVSLIDNLTDGDSKSSSESAVNDDSNSLSEKPVIDTGQIDSDTKSNSEENKNKVDEDQEDTESKDDDKVQSKEVKSDKESVGNINEETCVDGHDHNSKSLGIQNVNEFRKRNLKRSNSECDNEEPQDKVLKIKIKKLNEESEVSDAIEEPVLRVQGEGSGEENEGIYQNVAHQNENGTSFKKTENLSKEESPIVGETIEENVVYFYGEGSGLDCLTGNEENGKSSETHTNSEVKAEDKPNSSLTGSIKDNLSDFKDNKIKAKDVPHIKLGTIIDTKTDNVNRLPTGLLKKSRWDVETVEETHKSKKIDNSQLVTGKVKDLVNKFERASSPVQENVCESRTPPLTPKKATFFFGSLKTTSVSPSLTMGFGQSSSEKCVDSSNSNDDDNTDKVTEKIIENTEDKLKENTESKISVDSVKNTEKEHEEPEHSTDKIIEEIKKTDDVEPLPNDKEVADVDNSNKENDTCNEDNAESDIDVSGNSDYIVEDSCEENTDSLDLKLLEKSSETESLQPDQELLEKPSETESLQPDQKLLEKPSETESLQPDQKLLEKPSETESLRPDQKLLEKPSETESLRPDQKLLEKPSETESLQPDQKLEKPSETEIPEKQEDQNTEIKNRKTECTIETDQDKDKDEKVSDEKAPVIEPECVKKTAYVCGDDDDKEPEVSEPKETVLINDTKNEVEEDTVKKSVNESGEEEKPTNILTEGSNPEEIKEHVQSDKDVDPLEPAESSKENLSNKLEDQNIDKVDTENIAEKDEKCVGSNEEAKPQPSTNKPNIPEPKPHVSLRSVRSKKVASLNSAEKDEKAFLPAVETSPAETETIYLHTRRGRSKKQVAEDPLDGTATKKSKNDEEGESVTPEVIPATTKTVLADKDNREKERDNTSMRSADSSRVNSPVSVSDSIILLPDSSENTVDYPLKDPLANSDEEVPPPPKPLNLQSLSLDFNESSPPPPIPIIPSRRTLRKRGRDASPEMKEVAASAGKKMKLKGKRQVDTKLRKSIEQKKQQQVSSSDEVLDVSEDEKPAVKSRKKGRQGKNKKGGQAVEGSDEDSGTPVPKPKKKHNKTSRLLANLGITDDKPFESVGVRQSRRLAQIKIKEQAEGKKMESKLLKEGKTKKKKIEDKEYKIEKRKGIKEDKHRKEDTPESESEDLKKRKRRKYKYKAPSKIFDEKKPWRSSSESSEIEEELEEEEEVIEEEDPPLEFKSDHEFSPESDLEDDGESQPLRRARTARKNYEECDEEEPGDDCPCQKCGKSDHPEWILLCDKCDNGWHCSCLRPALLVIPEGDWFCPPCQHSKLVESLQAKLVEYDKKLSKKEIEDRRKERLAYVGISLNNVLPSREHVHKKKRQLSTEETGSSSAETEDSSVSESESDSDEPIYQLRQRRQAKSYKFNEFDDLIKSAIQDEIDEKGLETAYQSRGKDMATIVKADEEERKEKEQPEEEKEVVVPVEKPPVVPPPRKEYSDDDEIKPPVKKARRKARRINNLDVSSEEDDEGDEDFKGTSSESEEEEELEEEEESEEDSDDYVRGGKRRKNARPVRRSTRARVSRYDADFINDSDADVAPRKKKKKKYWSETDTEESDTSWGRGKKGRAALASKKKSKKKKKSILDELSDIEPMKKKKPKIKYGGLTSSEEDTGRRRRTRGKKTTYVDTLGSDSEEDSRRKKNPRRIESDDDEDFVANEDEKDSEGQDDEFLDEDDQEEEEEEISGRRRLIVPKIYIKKPPVSKEVERPKEKLHARPDKGTNEDAKEATNKPVEHVPKPNQEPLRPADEKLVAPQKLIEEKSLMPERTPQEQCGQNFKEDAKQEEKIKPLDKNNRDAEDLRRKGVVTDDDPIEKINKNLEEMDSDEMEKMMEEEEFANKQLQLVALQLEKEKKRKAEEAKRLETEMKVVPPPAVPAKRGRKPKPKEVPELPKSIIHEPIVSNVRALIRNDNDNDELSEPPGVALPLFEELATRKIEEETPKKSRSRGKGKKTLEETLANLGGKKNLGNKMPEHMPQGPDCNIEIAAPPQPFSQAAPMPSVITRMLQSKPGQATAYPVGTIRPKQFATMPDDDEDSPTSRSRGSSPSTGPIPGHIPPPAQFMPGGPRVPIGPPFRPMHQGMNHYPRGPIPPPHPIRGPGPPSMHPHLYHSHRSLDPSPSGGGPINMSEPNPPQVPPPPVSSPGSKMEPHNYSRTSVSRFPPITTPNIPMTPPRPMHMMAHMQQPRPSNMSPYPPPLPPHAQAANYYGGYPPEPMPNEETMPPTVFQNSPYPEQFPTELGPEPSENSNSKSYGDESGGEFGGLVSYFSSQREDDLES